jgi:hypothetical protein
LIRNAIEVSPDGVARGRRDCASNYKEGGLAMNFGLIITFAIVLAGLVFMLYGLIRPFTHIHHDHRDVFHPPHLD